MITALSGTSRHLSVAGGAVGLNINDSAPSAGLVRYRNHNLEVYDGSTWLILSGSIRTIGMLPSSELAIDWAMQKMREEQEYKRLAELSPAIKLALGNLEKAKQQLDVTIILSKEHESTS